MSRACLWFVVVAVLGFQAGALSAEEQPVDIATVPYDDYLDPGLPKDIDELPLKPYEGERYMATVPDTLDLAEYGRECVNFLTRLSSPEHDHWAYHILYLSYNPAILSIGHAQWKTPFFAECIPLVRAMSGSNENAEADRYLIGPLVIKTGKDGLCYMAVKDRPWALMDRITRAAGLPYADIMSQGYQLNAYAMWYQHDQNPLWKELSQRKIDRMLELTVPTKDGGLYFRQTRGYHPWFTETGESPLVPLGDGDIVYETMEGTPAGYTIAWTPQAASTWTRLTDHDAAHKLAEGTAHFLCHDKAAYDPQTKQFTHLNTVFTYMLESVLSHGLTVGDPDISTWAAQGVNQWYDGSRDPDRTGIVLSTEACQLAQVLQVALLLSRNGDADFWELCDRIIRNSLASMQITQADIDQLKAQPLDRAGDPDNKTIFQPVDEVNPLPLSESLPPGFAQPDDATERCRGAWFVSLDHPNASIACCNNRLTLALYLAWESIVESHDGELKVNLLMNRASQWADIDSYLPHEGKVVLRVKEPHKSVLLRVPAWADREAVTCTVTKTDPWGATRVGQLDLRWSDEHAGYLELGAAGIGDEFVVEFPMKEYVEEARLLTGPKADVHKTQVFFRGNTVVDLSDKSIGYPLHKREKYRAEQAGTRTVERFIYPHTFDRWGLHDHGHAQARKAGP